MVKIKVTNILSFTELIDHIKKTNYQNNEYLSTNKKVRVAVGDFCSIRIDSKKSIYPSDLFEIENEEEVTEETKFDNLVENYIDIAGDIRFVHHTNVTIKQRLADFNYKPQAFYSLNDDLTMSLIWKDGKLVD